MNKIVFQKKNFFLLSKQSNDVKTVFFFFFFFFWGGGGGGRLRRIFQVKQFHLYLTNSRLCKKLSLY